MTAMATTDVPTITACKRNQRTIETILLLSVRRKNMQRQVGRTQEIYDFAALSGHENDNNIDALMCRFGQNIRRQLVKIDAGSPIAVDDECETERILRD